MTDLTRRAVLASSGAVIAGGLSGCTSSADECSPATFPEGNATRDEPPEPCQFLAALEAEGLETDSTLSGGGGVSVMYHRDPERHREQIRTVALTFVRYRRIVKPGGSLSFTALESSTERHGVGYIPRIWAIRYDRGHYGEQEYVQSVVDTYETR